MQGEAAVMLTKRKGKWAKDRDTSSLRDGSRPAGGPQQLQLNKATINLIGPKFN